LPHGNGEIGKDGKPVKAYFQRHRTPDGDYVNKIEGVRQVPYQLPRLIKAIEQGKTVFITEGEKCVDAVFALGAVGTCNAGGARKFRDELVPCFKGADIIILPDNDAAGQAHLSVVVEKLRGVASRVRVLNLPGLPPKGDVADWVSAGGTLEQLNALVVETPDAAPDEPDVAATDAPEPEAVVIDFPGKNTGGKRKLHKPDGNDAGKTDNQLGFRKTTKGLLWSDDAEKPEIVVCGPIEVVAECRDGAGSNWGRFIRWRDADGRIHEWAMPVSLLAGDGLEVRKALLDGGLYVGAGSKARNLLTNYLASVHVKARARAVTTTGWHGHAFVFPDGALGIAAGDEHIIVQTGHYIDHAYNVRGTLEDWQKNVARYAEGNSRLTLAISMAFAAALIGPCGAESGGIHLRGNSSVGKTTALRVAASAWGGDTGKPDGGYIRSWRATANGLEGTGIIHNDTLLCLDELSQLAAKEAGEAAYMLSNGQGISRVSRSDTAQAGALAHAFSFERRKVSRG
jgi:hypothetical protein